MKEAFEKIKERLEEESHYSCFHCMDRALSIVSEVEVEYGNGKTNADRIRSMSDEELAEFLIYSEENYKLFTSDGKDFYTYEEALKHEIEWLKSPTTD